LPLLPRNEIGPEGLGRREKGLGRRDGGGERREEEREGVCV